MLAGVINTRSDVDIKRVCWGNKQYKELSSQKESLLGENNTRSDCDRNRDLAEVLQGAMLTLKIKCILAVPGNSRRRIFVNVVNFCVYVSRSSFFTAISKKGGARFFLRGQK